MSRKFLVSASALALATAGFIWAAPQVYSQTFVGTAMPAQYQGQGQPSTAKGEPLSQGELQQVSPLVGTERIPDEGARDLG